MWTTFNIGKPYPFRHDNYIFNLGSSLKGLLSSCTLRFQMEVLKTQINPFFYYFFHLLCPLSLIHILGLFATFFPHTDAAQMIAFIWLFPLLLSPVTSIV